MPVENPLAGKTDSGSWPVEQRILWLGISLAFGTSLILVLALCACCCCKAKIKKDEEEAEGAYSKGQQYNAKYTSVRSKAVNLPVISREPRPGGSEDKSAISLLKGKGNLQTLNRALPSPPSPSLPDVVFPENAQPSQNKSQISLTRESSASDLYASVDKPDKSDKPDKPDKHRAPGDVDSKEVGSRSHKYARVPPRNATYDTIDADNESINDSLYSKVDDIAAARKHDYAYPKFAPSKKDRISETNARVSTKGKERDPLYSQVKENEDPYCSIQSEDGSERNEDPYTAVSIRSDDPYSIDPHYARIPDRNLGDVRNQNATSNSKQRTDLYAEPSTSNRRFNEGTSREYAAVQPKKNRMELNGREREQTPSSSKRESSSGPSPAPAVPEKHFGTPPRAASSQPEAPTRTRASSSQSEASNRVEISANRSVPPDTIENRGEPSYRYITVRESLETLRARMVQQNAQMGSAQMLGSGNGQMAAAQIRARTHSRSDPSLHYYSTIKEHNYEMVPGTADAAVYEDLSYASASQLSNLRSTGITASHHVTRVAIGDESRPRPSSLGPAGFEGYDNVGRPGSGQDGEYIPAPPTSPIPEPGIHLKSVSPTPHGRKSKSPSYSDRRMDTPPRTIHASDMPPRHMDTPPRTTHGYDVTEKRQSSPHHTTTVSPTSLSSSPSPSSSSAGPSKIDQSRSGSVTSPLASDSSNVEVRRLYDSSPDSIDRSSDRSKDKLSSPSQSSGFVSMIGGDRSIDRSAETSPPAIDSGNRSTIVRDSMGSTVRDSMGRGVDVMTTKSATKFRPVFEPTSIEQNESAISSSSSNWNAKNTTNATFPSASSYSASSTSVELEPRVHNRSIDNRSIERAGDNRSMDRSTNKASENGNGKQAGNTSRERTPVLQTEPGSRLPSQSMGSSFDKKPVDAAREQSPVLRTMTGSGGSGMDPRSPGIQAQFGGIGGSSFDKKQQQPGFTKEQSPTGTGIPGFDKKQTEYTREKSPLLPSLAGGSMTGFQAQTAGTGFDKRDAGMGREQSPVMPGTGFEKKETGTVREKTPVIHGATGSGGGGTQITGTGFEKKEADTFRGYTPPTPGSKIQAQATAGFETGLDRKEIDKSREKPPVTAVGTERKEAGMTREQSPVAQGPTGIGFEKKETGAVREKTPVIQGATGSGGGNGAQITGTGVEKKEIDSGQGHAPGCKGASGGSGGRADGNGGEAKAMEPWDSASIPKLNRGLSGDDDTHSNCFCHAKRPDPEAVFQENISEMEKSARSDSIEKEQRTKSKRDSKHVTRTTYRL